MYKNFSLIKKNFEGMDLERLRRFLQSFSSKLKNIKEHCRDLVDSVDNIPYMTSVLGSGLSVTNDKTNYNKMSEEVYQKGMSILAHVRNNPNHNYSENEIIFVLGYTTLYHKKNEFDAKIG